MSAGTTQPARSSGSPATTPRGTPVSTVLGRRLVVGIGELAVTAGRLDVIVTHALGSCVAVCLWDPVAGVAGLLHFLLPESRINPARAEIQPGTFADTGIPLLLSYAAALGAQPSRMIVRLIGGAELAGGGGPFNVGPKNVAAARERLTAHGLLVAREVVGGSVARTVHLDLTQGRIRVTSGTELLVEV